MDLMTASRIGYRLALGIAATTICGNALAVAPPLGNISAISVGETHACAITTGGTVKCWSNGTNPGALGDGTNVARPVPGPVPGLASVAAISVGNFESCALTTGGEAKCWGDNQYGQLGDGTQVRRLTPVTVSGLSMGVLQIRARELDTCAVTIGGAAKCWGINAYGEVGDGTTTQRVVPTGIQGLASGVSAVAPGTTHSCALMTDTSVKCWGTNNFGEIGDGTQIPTLTPKTVTGLNGVVAIDAGRFRSCALTSAGAVKCWGANYVPGGQSILTPTDVPGMTSGMASVSSTGGHICGVTNAGVVKCVGLNGWGQMGDGTTLDRASAVDVVWLPAAVEVKTGGSGTCALTTAGQVYCWGSFLVYEGGLVVAAVVGFPKVVREYAFQTISFPAVANPLLSDGTVQLNATSSSGLPVTYTVRTPGECSVSGRTVTLLKTGACTITADQAGDADYYVAQVHSSFLIRESNPPSPPRLANISSRGLVGLAANQLIGGFAIKGPASKTVIIRARGPSLVALGVGNGLADPRLALYFDRSSGGSSSTVAQVDDWQTEPSASLISSLGFAPADAREPAMIRTLPPGLYTAVVQGSGGTTGVATVEIFEVDLPDDPLLNISTRAQVLTGNEVLIGGFIIQGSGPQTVVVRASGPSMSGTVPGALVDPTLTLVRSSDQTIIATNDDWGTAANAGQLQASGYAPLHARESAILITLNPGAYTAIVRGARGEAGVGTVEVFAMP